ncbi:DUF1772 domain-containing protein [Kitasatospora camelliae]|uniref:Anthrone oxygenase family protein n=1 Tax=Kitasatospora camelliae TaxID=3156397 RepID=A0AAU8JWJ0_9ACTN
MATARIITLVAAVIATGLSAGLFYAYACSVMPGLGRADDRTFVEAMQRINVAILNGWFMLSFLGALVLIVAAGVLHLGAGARSALPWIAVAAVLYLAMLVITGVVNVPLNDRLAAAGSSDSGMDLAAVRADFEAVWVRWNVVRAVVSTAAFGFLTWALVAAGRATGRS